MRKLKIGDKVRVKRYKDWPYKYSTNGHTIVEKYEGKIFTIKAMGETGPYGQYNHNKQHTWYKFVTSDEGVVFTADHLELIPEEFFSKDLFEL